MKLTMRLFNSIDDYWRIREFLRQVMLLNNRRDLSWHVTRWDYLFWSIKPESEQIRFEGSMFIWETESGQIAAVLHPEDRRCVFLQIHPGFCTTELEEEMIATAEKHLTSATLDRDGKPRIWVSADLQDKTLQATLPQCGYQRINQAGTAEYKHRRSLDEPLPDVPVTPGYAIRALGDGLARAIMIEGMHRLKRMGCKMAFVSGSSEAANALYASVMGGEHDLYELWEKIIES